MHKHFRMIAISEHLRNHGIDPDRHQHTRIPFIWQKLRAYYNLDFIDERENIDDEDDEERYIDFALPLGEYMERMMYRAIADPSEAPTSPPELDVSPPPPHRRSHNTGSNNRRKRTRDSTSKTAAVVSRVTDAEDTEDGTDAPSPASKQTRRSRGRTRTASKAEKTDTTEDDEPEEDEDEEEVDEEAEDDDESGDGDDDESEEEDIGTPAKRSKRGTGRTRGATRTSSRRKGK